MPAFAEQPLTSTTPQIRLRVGSQPLISLNGSGAADDGSWGGRKGTGSVQWIGSSAWVLTMGGFRILLPPNVPLPPGGNISRSSVTDSDPVHCIVLNTVPNHQDQFWDLIASPELLSTPIVLPSSQRAQVKDGELSLPSFMELADSLVLFRDEDVSQIRVRFLHETGSATERSDSAPATNCLMDLLDGWGQAPQRLLYVAGDTLSLDDVKTTASRFPGLQHVVTQIRGRAGFVIPIVLTVDATEAVQTSDLLIPFHTLPEHFDRYDDFKADLDFVRESIVDRGWSVRIVFLMRDEEFVFSHQPTSKVHNGI